MFPHFPSVRRRSLDGGVQDAGGCGETDTILSIWNPKLCHHLLVRLSVFNMLGTLEVYSEIQLIVTASGGTEHV